MFSRTQKRFVVIITIYMHVNCVKFFAKGGFRDIVIFKISIRYVLFRMGYHRHPYKGPNIDHRSNAFMFILYNILKKLHAHQKAYPSSSALEKEEN